MRSPDQERLAEAAARVLESGRAAQVVIERAMRRHDSPRFAACLAAGFILAVFALVFAIIGLITAGYAAFVWGPGTWEPWTRVACFFGGLAFAYCWIFIGVYGTNWLADRSRS